VLEDIGLGNRLARGRNYARQGQVVSLDIDAGLVSALVQGSRSRPYRVRIGIRAFGKGEWAGLEADLAASAWYTAKLLAGEMPEDIEDVFSAAGLSLFPSAAPELSLDCSCPDYEVPCKHIAAAFYLLAEAFDEDPFTILAWRGRDREDLLPTCRQRTQAPSQLPTRWNRSANRSTPAWALISAGRQARRRPARRSRRATRCSASCRP